MSEPHLVYTVGKANLQLENIGYRKWSVYFNVKPANHFRTIIHNVAYPKAMKRFNLCSEAMRGGKTNFT